jgi:hypothetical protein
VVVELNVDEVRELVLVEGSGVQVFVCVTDVVVGVDTVTLPNAHVPYIMPSPSGAKNLNRLGEKSRPA